MGVLDMMHFEERIYSGEYLAEKPLAVTQDFGTTPGIFTITRDNTAITSL